ncbi:unnamed protein product [Bemisia tabaci]|uniref:Uncharacterized protein n=1 Tax=Bemisia tabaci TaxID=7038 RepID=A0A9P0ACY2_BEMTA|nr:unnamed protein product [Bemisia tabaci]
MKQRRIFTIVGSLSLRSKSVLKLLIVMVEFCIHKTCFTHKYSEEHLSEHKKSCFLMPGECSLISSKSHECFVLEGSAMIARTSRRVLASLTALLGARPYVIRCLVMPCSWIACKK